MPRAHHRDRKASRGQIFREGAARAQPLQACTGNRKGRWTYKSTRASFSFVNSSILNCRVKCNQWRCYIRAGWLVSYGRILSHSNTYIPAYSRTYPSWTNRSRKNGWKNLKRRPAVLLKHAFAILLFTLTNQSLMTLLIDRSIPWRTIGGG